MNRDWMESYIYHGKSYTKSFRKKTRKEKIKRLLEKEG